MKSIVQAGIQLLISLVIIHTTRYTEIDFSTYMQQVKLFLGGERSYDYIKGDTGPLVYPAGFLYFYTLVYYITNRGSVRIAQYLFSILQTITVYSVSKLYNENWYLLIPVLLSKRTHSIYVLRMFNDPVGMLVMYWCVLALLNKRWMQGALLYSLALSIKMNILLFAPGMAFIYFQEFGLGSIMYGMMVLWVQLLLAYPFWQHWEVYLTQSFNFKRVFLYKWTVNWKLVSKETFLSSWFSVMLLGFHVILLLLFFLKWCDYDPIKWLKKRTPTTRQKILDVLFTCNFIGVVCARSLHYQFYSWYVYTLPYLLSRTRWKIGPRVVMFVVIEMCWNVYPSSQRSSTALLVCHLLILIGLYLKYDNKEKVQ